MAMGYRVYPRAVIGPKVLPVSWPWSSRNCLHAKLQQLEAAVKELQQQLKK